MQDSTQSGWLFLSSQEKKHEALKPLITARLDIAINELLSLTNPPGRIWIILDELTSLHKIPTLTKLLAKGRKSGACVVVGVQNYAQLAEVYGHHGARVISSLLNTRFMFRQPDPEMAAWSAKNLGEITLDTVREGLSYGVNTLRDGVSINRQEVRKPLISPSEILSLNDLQCYLRLPGCYPITKVTFNYTPYPKRCANFLARECEENSTLSDLDALVEQHDKPIIFQKPDLAVDQAMDIKKLDQIFEI